MKIRVHDGTAKTEFLCKSCNYSFIREFDNGDLSVACVYRTYDHHPPPLRHRVLRCNAYTKKGERTIHEYQQAAWVLRTEKAGRKIGFTPYRDLSDKEREKISEELDEPEWMP